MLVFITYPYFRHYIKERRKMSTAIYIQQTLTYKRPNYKNLSNPGTDYSNFDSIPLSQTLENHIRQMVVIQLQSANKPYSRI